MMKRVIWIPLCFLLLFCTSCSAEPGGTPPVTQSAEASLPEPAAEPSWAQVNRELGQLYTGLNLDGIGEADDEVYTSVYVWGEHDHRGGGGSDILVVSVKLGSGETGQSILLSTEYSLDWGCSLYTGRLFSEEKDAIVIELPVPASNYGAADVYVLDVYPPFESDPSRSLSIVERLNSARGLARWYSGETIQLEAGQVPLTSGDGLFPQDTLTMGAAIVEVPGQRLQGITLYATDNVIGNPFQAQNKTIVWDGDGWAEVT